MHTTDIKVFCIAQTRLNWNETREWLDHIGTKNYDVPFTTGQRDLAVASAGGEIEQQAEVTDAGAVCGLCAKRCYMSFEPGLNPNVTKVRRDWYDYLTNILKSGHGSVTEHATWTFAIEGITRVATAELNRHRAGVAISEGSGRYIRFDDIGFWMPISLQLNNKLLWSKKLGLTEDEFEKKKEATQLKFKEAFTNMEDNYKELCVLWDIENIKSFAVKKKLTSMFRRLVGIGASTGGTWTFNTRALRHITALRTSSHAEEEIAYLIGIIGKYMVDTESALFSDFERDSKTGAWVPKHHKV